MPEPVVALVVAAGLGLRYGGSTPKPALRLTGKALIGLSIEALAAGGCTDAVVVLNPDTAHHLTAELAVSPIPVTIAMGGSSRQESVRNGLDAIRSDEHLASTEVVLIHDAVRPMVPASVVADVIAAVAGGAKAVTPVVTLADSVRMIGDDPATSAVVDRSRLRAIQTPQGFPLDVICEAHAAAAESETSFTDDVSCAEALGHPVTLIEGSRLAMKITEPTDLTVANALWKIRNTIGHHSGRRLLRHVHHGE
ncbi:2-C-methyl-D-erythritol 4-phosphate cytidylyltransferase [Propionicicella superfundia]|uniref:2-C-methyl-D-erythritol 4-phosphate cytidylyltransferase n=1 Tax=Propionicicella superfundia TaxID=348582 RepID=UPI00040148A1|nr:2-C-methyl-D-erythritol 4-phosphate cytidylyltransferase [Propionicicella superfundia]